MSRATRTQVSACRAVLKAVALRVRGTVRDDRLFVGDVLVAQRIGHTVVVSDVWEPAGRTSSRLVLGSETFFATDLTETIAASITKRLAARARIAATKVTCPYPEHVTDNQGKCHGCGACVNHDWHAEEVRRAA